MSKCDCYQFETKRRYLSNIDKITYTLATERLAPEYIPMAKKLRNYEKISDIAKRQELLAKAAEEISKAAEEKKNLSTSKNVLEEIEDLIGEYWGTEPIYYTDSKNKEEADAAKLCCKILEAIRMSRGENDEKDS